MSHAHTTRDSQCALACAFRAACTTVLLLRVYVCYLKAMIVFLTSAPVL
jgi:hypothetical protein